ncbi:neuropeptide F-like [Bacillus rossius redtenbacheri]|uniref:neuropeptide F-like n=1 Tax=Bacillus rossius redtenbacheri TaxID=93214 RepID=UPI002FDEB144
MTAQCWLLALVCVLALAGELASPALARPSPDPDQLAAMADALKYLQELDRYYSQVARPSPRSQAGTARPRELSKMENAIKMLQLQELDRMYAQRTRPRFGKRAELRPADDSPAEDSSEKGWRHFPQRR